MGTARPVVLVVDDDLLVLHAFVRALRDFEPLQAIDGLEAREILSEALVDVVVCDLEMPGLGGLELMTWAREYCPHPEWVMVSGRGTFEAAIQALKLGAFDFICKPLQSPVQLQTAVTNAARHKALVVDLAERRALEVALRQSLEARDEFLATAAHELRTPLAALQLQLQGTTHLLGRLAGPAHAKLAGKLEVACRQAAHLGAIVDSMLDAGRWSQGGLQLEPDDVDLVALARVVVERHAPQARRAGSTITLDADPEVVGRWDRARLDQVVTNLIANSIKYGLGRPVRASVQHIEGSARLVVEDHGIGIRPEDLDRVFMRFERAVSTRHYGGLGLGLYMSRRIVEAHGGTIDAASELDHGTTFTVRIPLRPAYADARPPQAAA